MLGMNIFGPLLILKSKTEYTLALALPMFISAEGGSEWGLAMALAVLTSILPFILFIICQKIYSQHIYSIRS